MGALGRRDWKNACPGALQDPARIVVEPATFKDNWGYTQGKPGIGVCRSCEREIGLTPKGRVLPHIRTPPRLTPHELQALAEVGEEQEG